MPLSRTLLGVIKRLWASPYTLLAALIGLLGLATGGGWRVRDGLLEFYGGAVRWLLERIPIEGGAAAMTLGHAVLGRSIAELDRAAEHEKVHVRQFERWGPLMGPAYLLASVVVWLGGGDAYRDNPFEREAYDEDQRCGRGLPPWRR